MTFGYSPAATLQWMQVPFSLMSSIPAEFRSAIIKSALSAIEQTPQARDVLDHLPEGRLGEIRSTARNGWTPAQWVIDLYAAVMSVSGELGLKAFNRQQTYHLAELPILRPMVRVAVSTFGNGPKTLFRLLPKACAATARGVGDHLVQFGPGQTARIRWTSLAPELRNRAWAVGQAAHYTGMLDLGGAEGEVLVDDARIEQGEVEFRASWQPVRERPQSARTRTTVPEGVR